MNKLHGTLTLREAGVSRAGDVAGNLLAQELRLCRHCCCSLAPLRDVSLVLLLAMNLS